MSPEMKHAEQMKRMGFTQEQIRKACFPAARRSKVGASGHLLEHYEQVEVIKWANRKAREFPALRLLFAVPNAGKRSQALASMMRAEGMKAGVPDLMFPVRSQGWLGCAIEMKSTDPAAKASEEQEWWIGELRAQGWYACVCRGHEEAIHTLGAYLGIFG